MLIYVIRMSTCLIIDYHIAMHSLDDIFAYLNEL